MPTQLFHSKSCVKPKQFTSAGNRAGIRVGQRSAKPRPAHAPSLNPSTKPKQALSSSASDSVAHQTLSSRAGRGICFCPYPAPNPNLSFRTRRLLARSESAFSLGLKSTLDLTLTLTLELTGHFIQTCIFSAGNSQFSRRSIYFHEPSFALRIVSPTTPRPNHRIRMHVIQLLFHLHTLKS